MIDSSTLFTSIARIHSVAQAFGGFKSSESLVQLAERYINENEHAVYQALSENEWLRGMNARALLVQRLAAAHAIVEASKVDFVAVGRSIEFACELLFSEASP